MVSSCLGPSNQGVGLFYFFIFVSSYSFLSGAHVEPNVGPNSRPGDQDPSCNQESAI